MGIKFPNVMVELFNQHHLEAALNEAERLGYTPTDQDTADVGKYIGKNTPFITAAHFGSDGGFYIFQWFTKAELACFSERAAKGDVFTKDYLGCKFVKLRKVRTMYNALNGTNVQVKTVSQDNQSVLTVIDRATAFITVVESRNKPHDVDAYMYDYGHLPTRQCAPNSTMVAPYGQLPTSAPDKPDLCTCKGVPDKVRKECNYGKCYGGTCWFNRSYISNEPVEWEPVKWVRPKAENPISTRVVRFLAVSGSKVASAVKRVVKFLRGGL